VASPKTDLAKRLAKRESFTMANDTVITVIGNLTADPELRYTQAGVAVANFTVASTSRAFNRETNQFEDGDTLFLRCSVWREAAEHLANSLGKGTRVIAQGRLKQRSYEKDGENRTILELEVDEVGPSLRYATAQVARATGQGAAPARAGAAPADSWATSGGDETPW
jgi:single-strand DNA-binding protein